MALVRLTFGIRPSPSTADHEARPLVDGRDVLPASALGLDPPDLVNQLCPPKQGFARIGRCDCGVVGCGDEAADIRFEGSTVIWKLVSGPITFDRAEYQKALNCLQTDRTWEDLGRRVERLLQDRLKADARWQEPGLRLDWVSTRITPRRLHVSLSRDGVQDLLMAAWDGETEASALDALAQLLDKKYGR